MSMNHKHYYPHTDAEVAANVWLEITEKQYHEMLGCLPPTRWVGKAFAVGEPMNYMDDGRVVHTICIGPLDGKFYSKPYPVVAFDPNVFAKEIKAQNYVGRFARSIETGWLGKVIAVEDHNGDVMLKMGGVNELVRLVAGKSLTDSIDADDTQWFAPEDVKFVKVV